MGRGGDRSQSRGAKAKRFKRRKEPSDAESGRDLRPAPGRRPFSPATAWPGYWMLGLVLAAAAVTFGGAIEFPFSALDDRLLVLGNLSALHPQGAGLLSPFRIPFGDRHWAIGALWLIFEGALFGDWPAPFHALNVLFHLANVFLAFRLITRMGASPAVAASAAAIFAVHPLVVEPVCRLSGCNELIGTTALLGAIVIATKVGPGASEPRPIYRLIAAFLGALSALAGAPFTVTPLIMWIVIRAVCPSWDRLKILAVVGPAAVAAAIGTAIDLGASRPLSTGAETALPAGRTLLDTLALGIQHLIWPRDLVPQYYLSSGDPSHWMAAPAVALIIAVAIYAIRYSARGSVERAALGFTLIGYLPVAGFWPRDTPWTNDLGLYLPLAGVALSLAIILPKYWPQVFVAIPLIVPVLALLSLSQSSMWSTPVGPLSAIVAHYPDQPAPLNQLGFAYLRQQEREQAISTFIDLDQVFPDFPLDRGQRAWAYSLAGVRARSDAIVARCIQDRDVQCALWFWVELVSGLRNPSDSSPKLMASAYEVSRKALKQNYDAQVLREIAGWLRNKGFEELARQSEADAAVKESSQPPTR